MNIVHYEKNFQYTDKDLLLVVKKLGKLATYCKRIKDEASLIKVEVEGRKTQKKADQIKMSVTVDLPDKTLRAESRKGTVSECIDRCMIKLQPQVKKYKDRHKAKRRK